MSINDPILHWTMDTADISGSTLVDKGSGGNNGILIGSPTTGATGKVRQAVTFSGTNQVIQSSSTTSIPMGGTALSMSLWVKPSNTNGGIVAGRWNDLGGNYHYIINAYPGLNLGFYTYGTIGAIFYSQIAASNLGDGNFHHMVVTATADSVPVINIYYDSVLTTGGITGSFGIGTPSDTPFVVAGGLSGGTPDNFFAGTVDDVWLFNRVLNQQEVNALFLYNGLSQAQNSILAFV